MGTASPQSRHVYSLKSLKLPILCESWLGHHLHTHVSSVVGAHWLGISQVFCWKYEQIQGCRVQLIANTAGQLLCHCLTDESHAYKAHQPKDRVGTVFSLKFFHSHTFRLLFQTVFTIHCKIRPIARSVTKRVQLIKTSQTGHNLKFFAEFILYANYPWADILSEPLQTTSSGL